MHLAVNELDKDSGPDISKHVQGKIIKNVTIESDRNQCYINITFTDDSELLFRYDFVHTWSYHNTYLQDIRVKEDCPYYAWCHSVCMTCKGFKKEQRCEFASALREGRDLNKLSHYFNKDVLKKWHLPNKYRKELGI